MYRFLLSPRWIGLGLLMTLAAAGMVGLGVWQLDRYHHRSAVNARIDAASATAPVPLAQVLAAPRSADGGAVQRGAADGGAAERGAAERGAVERGAAERGAAERGAAERGAVDGGAVERGAVGPAPSAAAAWTRAIVTGRYDPTHEILARARTVNNRVGFEVFTPLVLTDGSAVLVDRGWVPPSVSGAATPPQIPAAPTGEVTVVGRVHAPESRASGPEPFGGLMAVRRVAPELLAPALPYPLYGAYLTLESQRPPADPAFVAIAPAYENAGMNAGYVVQWWLFAALTLFGYGYLVVRTGRGPAVSRRS